MITGGALTALRFFLGSTQGNSSCHFMIQFILPALQPLTGHSEPGEPLLSIGILYALILMTSVGWTTSPTPIWNVPSTSAEGWVSRPPVAQDADATRPQSHIDRLPIIHSATAGANTAHDVCSHLTTFIQAFTPVSSALAFLSALV